MLLKLRPVLVPHESVICRYFLRSTCREGDQCYFSHDTETAFVPDRVCRYFLKHRCEYGPLCKFEHVLIKRPAGVVLTSKKKRKQKVSVKQNVDTTKNTKEKTSIPKGKEKTSIPKGKDKTEENENNTKQENSDSDCKDEIVANEIVLAKSEQLENTKVKIKPSPTAKYIPHFGWYDPEALLRNFSYGDTSPSDLCTYYMFGPCPFDDRCPYTHGYVCELCGFAVLSPTDEEQRKTHIEGCEKNLIDDMELSFAVQRSKDKTCGICMEVIFEKTCAEEQRFGILENCNHVFCLTCIRKWRKTKDERTDSEPANTRSCPHCRIPSDFIVPSSFWFETEKDKEKLIADFKETMSKKPCRYFRQGEGTCPFGGFCFYLHALPDGVKVNLPPPSRKRRRRNNADDLDSIALAIWLQQQDREGINEFEISNMSNDFQSSNVSNDFQNLDIDFESLGVSNDFESLIVSNDFESFGVSNDFESFGVSNDFESSNVSNDFESSVVSNDFQSSSVTDAFKSSDVSNLQILNTLKDFQRSNISGGFHNLDVPDDFQGSHVQDDFQGSRVSDDFESLDVEADLKILNITDDFLILDRFDDSQSSSESDDSQSLDGEDNLGSLDGEDDSQSLDGEDNLGSLDVSDDFQISNISDDILITSRLNDLEVIDGFTESAFRDFWNHIEISNMLSALEISDLSDDFSDE